MFSGVDVVSLEEALKFVWIMCKIWSCDVPNCDLGERGWYWVLILITESGSNNKFGLELNEFKVSAFV